MAATYKIKEAEFFLENMRVSDPLKPEFLYYLSAFLCAARGTLDHMLYDYAEKFQLGITLDDKLDRLIFEKLAITKNNRGAIDFIRWYKEYLDGLEKDSYYDVLATKRNIVVHRGRPSLMHMVTISEILTISSSVSFEVRDEHGNVIQVGGSASEPKPSPPPTRVEQDLRFQEFPNEPIIQVCEKFLQLIKKMTEEGQRLHLL